MLVGWSLSLHQKPHLTHFRPNNKPIHAMHSLWHSTSVVAAHMEHGKQAYLAYHNSSKPRAEVLQIGSNLAVTLHQDRYRHEQFCSNILCSYGTLISFITTVPAVFVHTESTCRSDCTRSSGILPYESDHYLYSQDQRSAVLECLHRLSIRRSPSSLSYTTLVVGNVVTSDVDFADCRRGALARRSDRYASCVRWGQRIERVYCRCDLVTCASAASSCVKGLRDCRLVHVR